METWNQEMCREALLSMAKTMIESKELLCEIDGKIGDGDHGIGIERGFLAVKALLEERDFGDIKDMLQEIGMTMLNSMGGASGVIFSALFLGAREQPPMAELTTDDFARVCRTGLDKIKQRGKANLGDKTMVDALQPAVEAMEAHDKRGFTALLTVAANAAAEGAAATKAYPAKFGRAKFLKERSVGFEDAGATSVMLMFRALADWSVKSDAKANT